MKAQNNKTYDIFITHAWRYHDDWKRMGDLLDESPGLSWRNFSVPWHDPAMTPNSEVGNRFIMTWLENQIIPVNGVIFLSGVYNVKSCRKWLDIELEMARKHKKPVVCVPPFGKNTVCQETRELCDQVVSWNVDEIIVVLDKLMGVE